MEKVKKLEKAETWNSTTSGNSEKNGKAKHGNSEKNGKAKTWKK